MTSKIKWDSVELLTLKEVIGILEDMHWHCGSIEDNKKEHIVSSLMKVIGGKKENYKYRQAMKNSSFKTYSSGCSLCGRMSCGGGCFK